MRAAGDEQQRGNREARERTHGDSPGDDGGGIVPARRRARRAFSPNRRSAWPNGTVAGKRRRGFAERSHGAVRRRAVATCRSYRERHFIAELRNVDMATSPAPSARRPVVELRGVGKTYAGAQGGFTALTDLDLVMVRGELTAIVGQSGSGKSTLLNLIAAIDRPTRGDVIVDGTALDALPERALSAWRGRAVGIVFQFFQLLPTLTAAENVMLPMDFCRTFPARERRGRALQLLERLGVASQADKLPGTLSGGQQQRVAVARALANEPALLLADEPTGNLDSASAAALLDVLSGLVRDGQSVVVVTHDRQALRHADRAITLVDGRLASIEARTRAG
jgi:putative ABC transport system ATP-binding protein